MEKENEIIELLKQMQNSIDSMDNKIGNMDSKIQSMDSKIDKLESGQSSILEMLQNIDAKQAKNHLEMLNEFKEVNESFSQVEIVTARNWSDIIKLKMAR